MTRRAERMVSPMTPTMSKASNMELPLPRGIAPSPLFRSFGRSCEKLRPLPM